MRSSDSLKSIQLQEMLLNLKLSPSIFTSLHQSISLSKSHLPSSLSVSRSTTTAVNMPPSISVIDHIVLFKVRDSTIPSLTETMISNLRSLASLNIATHITAGPILSRRSPAAESLGFTHLLYSRYRSKADLSTYSAHPAHLAVVNQNVLPICDDIMAVDWIAEVDVDAGPSPGSGVRLTLAKPRDGTAAGEIVEAMNGIRGNVPESVRVSYGENFSPARAKGYEFGFISVFPGLDEVEEMEGSVEVERQKEKIRPLIESAVVVDYLVPNLVSSI